MYNSIFDIDTLLPFLLITVCKPKSGPNYKYVISIIDVIYRIYVANLILSVMPDIDTGKMKIYPF